MDVSCNELIVFLSSSFRHFIYSHFWFAFPVRDFINKLIEILIIYNEINPVQQFSRSTPSPFSDSPFRLTRFSYLAFPSSTGLRLYCLISRFAFHICFGFCFLFPQKKRMQQFFALNAPRPLQLFRLLVRFVPKVPFEA